MNLEDNVLFWKRVSMDALEKADSGIYGLKSDALTVAECAKDIVDALEKIIAVSDNCTCKHCRPYKH